jgi:TonB family protein
MSSLYLEPPDKLNLFLGKALLFHLILVLFFFLSKFIMKWDIFHSFETKQNIKIVESSVRVDIVALPKLTLQELKKIELGSSVAQEAEDKTTEALSKETSEIEFKKKSKKVNLSNLLKNLSKKKIAKAAKKKSVKKPFDARALNKLIIEGNKVSKGSSITGEQVDMSQQIFVAYIQELPDKVRVNWKLPTYMVDKNLQCRVQLFIGPDGRVIKMKLFESSGDNEYDSRAMDAVRKTSPLPKPPSSILSSVASGSVILGFPL